ncbi:MAG: hypothetical protein ACFCUO_00095 [Rhodospirillales bacterium]
MKRAVIALGTIAFVVGAATVLSSAVVGAEEGADRAAAGVKVEEAYAPPADAVEVDGVEDDKSIARIRRDKRMKAQARMARKAHRPGAGAQGTVRCSGPYCR